MGPRLLSRLCGALLLAGLATAPLAAPAAAHGPTDVEFNGGSIAGLWEDEARTRFAFDNLHYEFDQCGTRSHELTCTWSIEVVLRTGPRAGCPPVAPSELVVWSSGEQSGNGGVDSGPQGGTFPACQDHSLAVAHRFSKTYGPWEEEPPPPLAVLGGGGTFALLPVGAVADAEQAIVDASPPARTEPRQEPAAPRLRIGSRCRSLHFESRRYAFKFRRLGCWKASRLVRLAWPGTTPRGYRCAVRAQRKAGRGTHRRNPKKFFAWHPPRKRKTKR